MRATIKNLKVSVNVNVCVKADDIIYKNEKGGEFCRHDEKSAKNLDISANANLEIGADEYSGEIDLADIKSIIDSNVNEQIKEEVKKQYKAQMKSE